MSGLAGSHPPASEALQVVSDPVLPPPGVSINRLLVDGLIVETDPDIRRGYSRALPERLTSLSEIIDDFAPLIPAEKNPLILSDYIRTLRRFPDAAREIAPVFAALLGNSIREIAMEAAGVAGATPGIAASLSVLISDREMRGDRSFIALLPLLENSPPGSALKKDRGDLHGFWRSFSERSDQEKVRILSGLNLRTFHGITDGEFSHLCFALQQEESCEVRRKAFDVLEKAAGRLKPDQVRQVSGILSYILSRQGFLHTGNAGVSDELNTGLLKCVSKFPAELRHVAPLVSAAFDADSEIPDIGLGIIRVIAAVNPGKLNNKNLSMLIGYASHADYELRINIAAGKIVSAFLHSGGTEASAMFMEELGSFLTPPDFHDEETAANAVKLFRHMPRMEAGAVDFLASLMRNQSTPEDLKCRVCNTLGFCQYEKSSAVLHRARTLLREISADGKNFSEAVRQSAINSRRQINAVYQEPYIS